MFAQDLRQIEEILDRIDAELQLFARHDVRELAVEDDAVLGLEHATFAKVVKEVNGARVGIIGLTTPGVPSWENPENFVGLEFRDPVASARKWVAHLRTNERVDGVVVAMHMGIEADLRTGKINPGQVPMENAALAVMLQQLRGGQRVGQCPHRRRAAPAIDIGLLAVAE